MFDNVVQVVEEIVLKHDNIDQSCPRATPMCSVDIFRVR